MVAYRLSAQVIGRSTGRSATGAAAYRATCEIYDHRTGQTHDYTRKTGLLHDEIMAPENAADWMKVRAQLWNAIEQAEKRKDAQLCRELILNLPHELTRDQQIELVREFVNDELVRLGMIADVAIHAAHRKGDDRNIHAHVMLSMREILEGGKFGAKVRDWNSPELLEHLRERWAHYQNRALERAGRSERVDHRSLEAQGIDREPEPKQGPVATQMEREGRPSKAGDDRRAVKARNQQREGLREEAKIIDIEVARIEREEQRNERRRRQPVPPTSPEVQTAEKARFEEWANVRRAELQNSRLEAEGEQGRTHERERLALRNEQAINYGSLKKQAAATLTAIAKRQQERQERKGLGGILSRLSGAARRDSERAGLERATLANIERRENEQNGALTARQQAEKVSLSGQHAQEQAQLERRIEHARDRREREGWQPHRETRREATTGREAENLPVEGREVETGQTTPENEQAPTAPPETTQQAEKTETEAERNAAIDAEQAAQEARAREWRRDRGDDDGGRGRERTR